MFWDAVTAISSTISMVAFILTAIYVRDQLKGQQKDRFLHVTNDLFTTWQEQEFMKAQLWLIHQLRETTWGEFVARHRCDYGELAFHRVGSFYDRVGTLVRLGFVNEKEILSTIGGHAIAVWDKIGPMVVEARALENSALFDDFEHLLPACRECYIPTLALAPRVGAAKTDEPATITPGALKRRMDLGDAPTVLDVRQPSQVATEPRTLPHARVIPPDEVAARFGELPVGPDIAVYCA